MDRFKNGDRVHHIGRKEDGTVTVGRNGEIEVLFDGPAPSGKPSIGVFDENWFAMHPNWLQPAPPKLPDRHYRSDFKPR